MNKFRNLQLRLSKFKGGPIVVPGVSDANQKIRGSKCSTQTAHANCEPFTM
jgi:hypothetical protein